MKRRRRMASLTKKEVVDTEKKEEKVGSPSVKHGRTDEKTGDAENVSRVDSEGAMTPEKKKTAKIANLKKLLSIIQAYANFASEQVTSRKEKERKKVKKKDTTGMFVGQLRDYQVEGVRWLVLLHDLAVNGILADEMGLGKTVMVIAAIAKIIENGAQGPFLVIAPLSTLPNWISEIERFVPDIPVILYHGPAKDRSAIRPLIEEKHLLPKKYHPLSTVHPIVVTSYEMVLRDANFLSRIDWRILAIDEAQRIKNDNCMLRAKLRLFTTTRRLLLTGTPIQNSLSELWSLLSFLMPEMFKSNISVFESLLDELLSDDSSVWISNEQDAIQKKEIVNLLHNILRPFILRRLKEDVDLSIPPKKEVIVRCSLTAKQAELYEKIISNAVVQAEKSRKGELDDDWMVTSEKRSHLQTVFFGVDDDGFGDTAEDDELGIGDLKIHRQNVLSRTSDLGEDDFSEENEENENEQSVDNWLESCDKSLRNILMQLRKCVNHPFLFRKSFFIDEEFVRASIKLRILDCMLKKLFRDRAAGHKAIIYSQFVMNIDFLKEYCQYRAYQYVCIDGRVGLAKRSEAIKTFNTDPQVLIFLVSTRAGGLGINLTAADTVFLYDSDWNPQQDLQARDRCHRIGQTRPVVVYRLLVTKTIDEDMFNRASGKRRLERVVLKQGLYMNAASSLVETASNSQATGEQFPKFSLTMNDLIKLLKYRDWEEQDDSALNLDGNQQVVDKRIAELLDRSDLEAQWRRMQLVEKQ